MKTSGRLYADKLHYLMLRTTELSDKIVESRKNPVDATWSDAGTIDYISRLIDKAILELEVA